MRRFVPWPAGPAPMGVAVAAAAALLFAGCADRAVSPVAPQDDDYETVIPGLTVSEARAAASASGAAAASSEAEVAYVSAAPGTLPGALSVRVRNVTAGDPATPPIPVSDGGFDPVSVRAASGDQLELAITQLGGTIAFTHVVVPPRRPPTVVRTNPPRGRTDVALSIRLVIVFSEPIDPQSLDETSVTVLRGDVALTGVVSLIPGTPFMAEFVPDSPLEPSTEYELIVTTGVRDLDGDALPEEYRSHFTTVEVEAVEGARLVVSNVTTGGAFDLNGYRLRITAADDETRTFRVDLNTEVSFIGLPEGEVTVELEDVQANCSLSGEPSRTVSVAPSADVTLEYQVTCAPPPGLGSVRLVYSEGGSDTSALWAMNADGSDRRQLTSGMHGDLGPLVSPDGSRIAFTRGSPGRVYVMDADGGNVTALNANDPSGWSTSPVTWLPDGNQIAIQFGSGGRVDVIGADGTGRRILANDGRDIRAPAWSPDGRMIAFLRYNPPIGEFWTCDNSTGGHEIWLMDASGADQRMVRRLRWCHAGQWNAHLAWSSDGTRILFEETDPNDNLPALWSMNADGSGVVRLLPDWDRFDLTDLTERGPWDGLWSFGRWSSDAKMILLTRYGSALRRVAWPERLQWWEGESLWEFQFNRNTYLLNVDDGSVVRVTADGEGWGGDFAR
jgi:Tol biopolymer transport system component